MLRMIGIRDIDELYPVLALTEKYDIAGHINTGREFTAVETRTDTRVRDPWHPVHSPASRAETYAMPLWTAICRTPPSPATCPSNFGSSGF